MKEKLKEVFNKYNLEISDIQINQFQTYFNFLVQENQKFNLTAITEENEVIYKHFLDSCLAAKNIKNNSAVVDVGSGAGFPGVPLKILRPDLKITLLDSLQKRVNFLNQLIGLLGLKDIVAVHNRAEDFANKNREKFDYATSRAVAQINTLSEYLLPLVKLGGQVIMYKSQRVQEELEQGKNSILTLGGKLRDIQEIKLAEIDASRTLVFIDKIKSTPKQYPRGKNLPKTKPIM